MKHICIIAGMPRAATTFLYHTLAHHPSVFVPARKEIEFFSLNHDRGTAWYDSFFSSMENDEIGFDISPLYFFNPATPQRIVEWNRDQQVILILRNPAEFAVSFYKNRLATGMASLEFEDFISGHDYTKDNRTQHVSLRFGTITKCIAEYRKVFSDRLLLIDFRSIAMDPLLSLETIEKFLNLRRHFQPGNFDKTPVNTSGQLNIAFVNRLMHKRWFSDLAVRIFPKRIIMSARYLIQTSTRKSGSVLSSEMEDKILDSSWRTFSTDTDYMRDLFSSSSFILGSGRPFDIESKSENHSDSLGT